MTSFHATFSSLPIQAFCRLIDFSQKLNMVFLDFHNAQYDNKFTAELFIDC